MFILKLNNGFSSVVTVCADSGLTPPIEPKKKKGELIYIDAQKPISEFSFETIKNKKVSNNKRALVDSNKKDKSAEHSFNVPKAGKYFVLLRVRSDEPVKFHDPLFYSVDSQVLVVSHIGSEVTWGWVLAPHNKGSWGNNLQSWYLEKGKHSIKIAPRESLCLDLIAISTDPEFFKL